MRDLAAELSALTPSREPAPWPGHEHVRGWGVFALPFDSGHVLALRVFPQNDFAPYRSVWHRDPEGRWTITVDGPRLDTACPRYFGTAAARNIAARIDLTWVGPTTGHVVVDELGLDWTFTATAGPLLRALNVVAGAMPLASWRPRPLVAARERMARALGMGRLQMSGLTPSGHQGTLMPKRMYLIDDSRATLDGVDLGRPARLEQNPEIGGVPLPARGVLAIGGGMWEIADGDEYARLRAETDPGRDPALPQP